MSSGPAPSSSPSDELAPLLAGIVAFVEVDLHPGPLPVGASAPRDHAGHLVALSSALARLRALVTAQVGEVAEPPRRWVAAAHARVAPRTVPAAADLASAVGWIADVARELAAAPVGHHAFRAVAELAAREAARSPLATAAPPPAAELAPALDRIAPDGARAVVSRTLASIARMRQALDAVDHACADADGFARAWVLLAGVHAEASALIVALRDDAPALFAEAWEAHLFSVRASDLVGRAPTLAADAAGLARLRSALDGVGAKVALEARRAFVRELPAIDAGLDAETARARLSAGAREVALGLGDAYALLARVLGVRAPSHGDDAAARRERAIRLRRDVWMFGQVVRAFVAKADRERDDDAWDEGGPRLAFVGEFLGYFRALGYPLLRADELPHVDAFVRRMDDLARHPHVDAAAMATAREEARAFQRELSELVTRMSARDDLHHAPFDRRGAASLLRSYVAS